MRVPSMIASMLSVVLAALAVPLPAQEGPRAPSPGYRIIVHPENALASIDRKFLADVFLENVTRWPDDTVIYPVDLQAQAAVRLPFSQEVLLRSISAVKAYWQQRIFAGRGIPPPELEHEADVVAYVLQHEGAVGYVSSSFDSAQVKAITIR
jgi:hypothetical protein